MDPISQSHDHSPLRRCVCNARQELRWESPQRKMYSCGDCGIWWEESLCVIDDDMSGATESAAEESVGR